MPIGLEIDNRRGEVTRELWAIAYVPFGLLLCAALLAAEMTQDLLMARVNYTIHASGVMVIPAFVFILFRRVWRPAYALWLLFWTFAWVIYMVHFGYALLGVFGGSPAAVFADQGPLIAGSNFLFTIWWSIDVVLAWRYRYCQKKWVHKAQRMMAVYGFIVFQVAFLRLFDGGIIRVIGAVMTVSVAGALVVRWYLTRDSE